MGGGDGQQTDGPVGGGPDHGGIGRRGRARPVPKGRQLDPAALDAVRSLLGDRPRHRALLIEHLHLLQDSCRGLRPAHLAALAHEMRLSLAEVHEVASFYAHFDLLEEDGPAPEITLRVCDSLTCSLFGAEALHAALAQRVGGERVRVVRAPCMGRCATAPVAEVGHAMIDHATVDTVAAALAAGHTHPVLPAYRDIDAYRAAGGYRWLDAALAGRLSREDIVARLSDSNLRGLGGAGFPTGRKWSLVAAEPGPRMMAVNADEGEPGTFKDRHHLETDPHRVLEGMLLAGWVIEAEEIVFYLRDEYPAVREILLTELPKLEAAGLIQGRAVSLRRGAGAYICGEESAMLESIEGKRGLPRHRPPFAAQVGLHGRPTLINNVETLYWVPEILDKGAAWFAGHGRRGRTGLRSFSVSGRVRDPGVKLAPAGISVRELIDEHCGGMEDGHRFSAYLPGGASGGILPASKGDLPLDFGTLESEGCFIGSAAVIVLSDRDDPRAAAINLMRFFADESCGQCTPCRLGTEKALALMQRPVWDAALLGELGRAMRDASICGLGQAAPNPVDSVLKHFPAAVGATA